MSTFQRTTGAVSDVKECEYVAALHQTCLPDTRDNGIVSSLDIQRLLISRYGLYLSHVECIDILRGLSGGMSSEDILVKQEMAKRYGEMASSLVKKSVFKRSFSRDSSGHRSAGEGQQQESNSADKREDLDIPEEYLDLVQILGILLVPVLAQAAIDFRETNTETWQAKSNESVDSSLSPQPKDLVKDVLSMLLKNVDMLRRNAEENEDLEDDFPRLDIALVENILLECGENERVENTELVLEMMQVARSSTGRLDLEAFVNALTSDLDKWPVGSENRLTTFFYDVFDKTRAQVNDDISGGGILGASRETAQTNADPEVENQAQGKFNAKNSIDHNNIDFVMDVHASVWVVVVIWFFYFMSTITYASIFQALVSSPCIKDGREDKFGCQLSSQLWSWFVVALFLSLFGVAIVLPLNLGNNPEIRFPRRLFSVMVISAAYTICPLAITRRYIERSEEPYDPGEERANSRFFQSYLYITFMAGSVLTLYYTANLVSLLIYGNTKPSNKYWWIPSSTLGEARLKRAATRKLNKMLLNARKLHVLDVYPSKSKSSEGKSSSRSRVTSKAVDKTMLNYVLNGQESEAAGGILWTWKLLLSGNLFETEGIWLPTRLIVFQGAQVLLTIMLTLIYINITRFAADKAAEAQGSLPHDLPKWAQQIVPTRNDVNVALYPATIIAFIVMVTLTLIYIPSSVATILLYRCGQIPSLGSPYFRKYRSNVNTTYMNVGNAIYGFLGSSALFFTIISLIIFLFIWDFSRALMVRITAWGLGLGITIGLKMVLTKSCQSNLFKSFYRTKPRKANLVTLALETWFIGLGSSVLIGRISQFLFAAVFWVGRIDVPFLSEDVALFGYAFDYVPTNFAKELLVHEAHRHPYLERLSQAYLMRFRHKKEFGRNANAVWRQVFVQTLMPWMRKYRVFSQVRLKQSMEALAINKLIAAEDAKSLATRFGEDMDNLKGNLLGAATTATDGLLNAGAAAVEDVKGLATGS